VNLYAPVEGYAPPRISLDTPLHASLTWRTRPMNVAGLVQLGARPYDPIRRAFLAPDPLGHASDGALNKAFNGNPAFYFDADGRLAAGSKSSGYEPTSATMGVIGARIAASDPELFNELQRMYWAGPNAPTIGGTIPRHFQGQMFDDFVLGLSAMPEVKPSYSPNREFLASMSRFRRIGDGFGLVIGGFIPWVGDAMDVYDVAAPDSSALDRTLGGASLTANAWTAGLLPNLGPIRRGMHLIRGVDDVPHHFEVTPPHGGGPPTGGGGPPGGGGVTPYQVGPFDDLQRQSRVGDDLQLHHAGQKHPMSQIVPGYDPKTGPSIVLPTGEHQLIPNVRGDYSGTARDILAQDVRNLRNLTEAPNGALQDLIKLNKQMYPGSFTK
jgi:hypothetical protein